MQLIGRQFDEQTILNSAFGLEKYQELKTYL